MELPQYQPPRRALSAEDFDTASVHSAAPSYVSAAPTYRSIDPHGTGSSSSSNLVPRRGSEPLQPNLHHLRSSWSSVSANPTARHYHSVAQRRATVASAREERHMRAATLHPQSTAYKSLLERIEQDAAEEDTEALGLGVKGYRALEDPALVGEEAAERARQERLAKERGDAILLREDRRWDWLLGQMKDWDERDRSWKQFRDQVSEGKRTKLAKRLGLKHK